MKIAIVGGGISGLYAANLLEKNGHDITIFENNIWGGVIERRTIGDKSYPISTILLMQQNDKLYEYFDTVGLLSDYEYLIQSNDIDYFNLQSVVYILKFVILTSILGVHMVFGFKIAFILLMFFMIVGLCAFYPFDTKVKYTNFIQKQLLVNVHYPLFRAFGGIDTMNRFLNSTIDEINYTASIFEAFVNNYEINIPDSPGFDHLVNALMQNINIDYKMSNIANIYRTNNSIVIKSNNQTQTFDKLFLACEYESYKHLLDLTPYDSMQLSDVYSFDFYTVLIQTNDFKLPSSAISSIFFGDDVYLAGSSNPLDISDFEGKIKYFSSHKWRMGHKSNKLDIIESQINGKNNTHYIGKSISENGVAICMNYVENHLYNHGLIKEIPTSIMSVLE